MKKAKKLLLSLFALLTATTTAAQENDGMFYYAYDHDSRTATLTYRHVNDSKGGTYRGDVVIPAKAPNGYDVTVIGGDAFINSNDMTSLTIPASIDSIGEQPFGNCKAHLTKIIIEDGDTPLRCHVRDAWPRGCFPVFGRDVQVDEMYIGRNYHSFVSRGWVEAVYEGSWSLIRDSEYLKTVTMGDVFTEVPYAMFYGCTQLQTVNISPNITSVGKEAFWNCESLTDINLPDGVEVIDEEAFGHCKSLEPFDLPNALKLIGAKAFLDCDMFRSFTIPASVDSLGVSILDNCDNLKRIDIPYSPEPLKMSCSNQFNNSLRSAPIDTLWTDRYIDGAFSDNRTLKKIYIGSNVEALHDYLFSDCYSVDEVFSLNPVPPTCEGSSVFYSGIKQNGTLHVPAESIAAYMQAYVWKDFFNIQPIGNVEPGLDKDEEGNYLIASADDWRAFANLTIIEPSANAKMTADIDLGDDQTTVGTQEVPYAGTFDGNGHTLTVAYSQNITGLAPFRYINGATIQKIHITGTIDTQTGKCAAGIVSYSTGGTTTISECWSSAKLKGDDTMGGICAVIRDGTMNINDCLVDGTISGRNAFNGGFISHPDNTATVNINNGLFLRYADADVYWSGTFFRSDQDWFGPRNLYNCYYFYPYGYPQGIQATEEELTDGTLAVALQDGREEQIWGQNTDLNHPVPVVFLSHVAHSTEYETSCDYFDWHGQRYTTSGTYTYEEKNAQGEVTDIYTLELTIHYSTTSSLSMDFYVGDHYATDMYDFTVEKDGETTYYYTTTNAAGCDSVIVLGITILEPQTYETNATINVGESYEWRGNTYTEAGTYIDEVQTEYGGIKEIYILNLTVTESPVGLTQKQLFATRLADMHTARMSHQIMPVDDGIVVFGGHTSGFSMTRTAERYNFGSDTWTQMNMLYYQDYSAGIVTADGKMLLAGGMSSNSGIGASAQCELYDPTTNTFSSTGSLTQARSMATATMTKSGKIYVNGCWYNSSYGLECYDPETGSFSKVAEGLNAYHPNLLAMRGERIVIADGSSMVVVENGTTTPVESDLLAEFPVMKGWDETQMVYYQVADYSYILLGRNNTQAVLLNVFDDATEGIKVTKIAELPMTLPDDESVEIGYHDQASRVFIDRAAQKLYVQTCVLNDGCSPIIVEYDYPSAQRLEGGNVVVYATDKPLKHRTENAAWTMLADGTLVSVGGGNSNFDPHTAAYIYYLGDGSEDPDGIKEMKNEELRMKNEEAVYDLSGRRINGQWSMINGQLPKGIYIMGGRKVLK